MLHGQNSLRLIFLKHTLYRVHTQFQNPQYISDRIAQVPAWASVLSIQAKLIHNFPHCRTPRMPIAYTLTHRMEMSDQTHTNQRSYQQPVFLIHIQDTGKQQARELWDLKNSSPGPWFPGQRSLCGPEWMRSLREIDRGPPTAASSFYTQRVVQPTCTILQGPGLIHLVTLSQASC